MLMPFKIDKVDVLNVMTLEHPYKYMTVNDVVIRLLPNLGIDNDKITDYERKRIYDRVAYLLKFLVSVGVIETTSNVEGRRRVATYKATDNAIRGKATIDITSNSGEKLRVEAGDVLYITEPDGTIVMFIEEL